MLICTHLPIQKDNLFDKVLPVLISTFVVVVIFIVGRFLDSIIKGQEIRRNWYLKVLIEPNVTKLNDFYIEIFNSLNKSIVYLESIQNSISFNDYNSEKTQEIRKFAIIKRAFEFDFISLIQTNYPEIAEELTDNLRDLEDCVTNCLDKKNLSIKDFDNLKNEINKTKHCLFGILYKPLMLKKISLWKALTKSNF